VTTFGESLQALAFAQKPTRGAPAYSRWVNRRLGRLLAAGAASSGCSPTQLTVFGSSCTGSAIAVVAVVRPSPMGAAVVVVLLVIGYAFDAADGQLARLQGRATLAGEWLDHVLDSGKLPLLHLAVAARWYRDDPDRGCRLLVPIGFAVLASVIFAAYLLDGRSGRASLGSGSVVRSLLVAPTDYGLLCLAFVLWWWSPGFTVLYAGLFVANAVFAVVALAVWYRQLVAVGSRSPR
jgi:phosphatidylglycerophosphate synthase